MKEKWGEKLNVTYKTFVLEQANSRRELEYRVWDDRYFPSRDLPPLEASKCAEAQGPEAFEAFNLRLFRAQHVENLDIMNQLVLYEVAKEAGLDAERFSADLRGGKMRELVAQEHEEAVEKYGMFGVPTVIFENGESVFIKLEEGEWEGADDEALFTQIAEITTRFPKMLELKKPFSEKLAKQSAEKYKKRQA